jgi:hypothetical protein
MREAEERRCAAVMVDFVQRIINSFLGLGWNKWMLLIETEKNAETAYAALFAGR